MDPFSAPSRAPALPFRTMVSLAPLTAWWQAQATAAPASSMGRLAAELLAQAAAAPGLLADNPSAATLSAHAALVETLFSALIAPASRNTTLSGAIAPFDRQVLYATPLFRQTMVTAAGQLKQPLNLSAADTTIFLMRRAYRHLFTTHYGERDTTEESLLLTVADYESGLYRHFKAELDSRFLTVEVAGNLPVLSADDRQALRESHFDLAPWLTKLPTARFVLRGFLMLHLTDVTATQILSTLKNDLLARDVLLAPDRLEQLQEQLRALFRQPTLRLGLTGYKPRKGRFETFGQRLGQQTLSQHAEAADAAEANEFRRLFNQLARTGEPLVVPDVENAPDLSATLREQVRGLDIRSVALCPLRYGPDVLGVLELSSPLPGVLKATGLGVIEQFLPLFAVAVHRHQEAEWARVQAIVKERFTAIHPALEWRFVEAAEDLLTRQRTGAAGSQMRPIIFPEVYPLYAAIDVRGSSAARADAVRADLTEHLHLANRVLNIAAESQPLPIVEELRHFTRRNLLSLREGVVAEDEVTILDTLRTEIEPLLEYLRSNTPEARPAIQRYWAALDGRRGIVYRQRRAFEESLTQLNEHISGLIDVAEAEAQRVFPHYFRKSVTDGVEFDIYVGASLVENRSFDPVILKNLRLWQLRTLIEIAQATATLRPTLPVPLATTQLLLVNSQPLAVRFREDERQFDVDGAWNARYEIIKKRIDKATYLSEAGQSERLTQPGAIALVYQQPREAAEYEEYLAYLRTQNLIRPETEHLALEDAQGVRGLHALRVWLTD
ncbi:MAG: GAF domain-containing protein [Hymenobacteraceae bacterium]|nr:GAF domain-containing protein [Hymenobacteraceae bacterium]